MIRSGCGLMQNDFFHRRGAEKRRGPQRQILCGPLRFSAVKKNLFLSERFVFDTKINPVRIEVDVPKSKTL